MPSNTVDEIRELGRRWAEAEQQADIETLSTLLDADFMAVGPVGFVIDKEQYLAGRRSGDLKQEAFTWQDVTVRRFGDSAVAIGCQVQTATHQGRDASGRFRATQVLVRKGEHWRIAGLHLSPIAPAPGWILGALQARPGAQP
ncbi:MAG TPA: nuclear transport factor 2 family protein [Dehalococcoidia bacterium]|nr:nuclear transport factor 2 family protein [Dehalococcoidia bacterium]